ncbi:4-aminobutyrate--2-oxoglutarate transaminase [Marinomonas mediterranea]|jgi:4-aminobutyrate aminotransferase apoenzyme (EC 2.6.1.19)|uniref:4-aminobutyrate aminotransferase n=1 Tax=Marinomonas mediterranea (strain ATCC 700492 / JCM 21426 / NBRC 103028 / MMB-1) TaxID=717774 RepID=F2JUL9_MARM1|nr:4-aminobutyrate--2-oxoglutarate transaminase [Marinomonas mediterranea]ADZ89352.1 4-aminobutyrate aminotransferase [Marinomonas mediterranea MMB-1]WCN07453.1 4-aminobutyrate--2-oxoglutarate transaminase [Marinomonas mediterranea]WCN15617.1 4-aminobutyrate--2-oxoglutarate transaminase [Marinomonas mediterranea MMB-1]
MTTNANLQERKVAAIARGQGNMAPVYVERAVNAEVWDVEGKRHIDFGAGIAVCNTGHSHPKVVAAVKEQVERFSHTCVMVSPYESAVTLAEKLNEAAPGNTPKKSIFITTGAEAVENCVKIARAYTGRSGIIAFNGGFHGRTNMTMGLTGKVAPYKAGFGPFPNEIYHVAFPNEYHGVTIEQSLEELKMRFTCDIEPSRVAAIIIEPVQGEGGFYQAPAEFLQALRTLCDEHGILLILDEIQSGFGRTGKMFAHEHAGVEADLMTAAKGIAGGFPLAAVVGKADIMDAPLPGGLGGTYGGSPVGCAAGLAVFDVIEEEKLVDRAVAVGERFMTHLKDIQAEYPQLVGNVRNTGAMIAMEFVNDGEASKPNPELTKALTAKAAEKGLILLSCGIRGNVIRFLPALTIEMEIIDEGMTVFKECLKELV